MKFSVTIAKANNNRPVTKYNYGISYTWHGDANSETEAIAKAKSNSGHYDWEAIEVKIS